MNTFSFVLSRNNRLEWYDGRLTVSYVKLTLQKVSFLYDIKCSKSVDDYIRALGGNPIMYRTGASYTQYKVHTDDLPFGGEYSGHLYFRDRDADCGSAIYATLRLLEIMSKTNEKMSKMVKDFPKYYATDEIKIPVSDDLKLGTGMCGSISGNIPVTVGQPTIKVDKILVGGKGEKVNV